jgi:hypothetical protein
MQQGHLAKQQIHWLLREQKIRYHAKEQLLDRILGQMNSVHVTPVPLKFKLILLLGKEVVQLGATHKKFIRVLYLNMFRASICPKHVE